MKEIARGINDKSKKNGTDRLFFLLSERGGG
jgi:hypothetical protein